jgi:tRNA(adenine34) deaminase
MREALKEAQKAFDEGEIPVGAVVVRKGEVLSRAHNTREQSGNPLDHAELRAIQEASKATGNWRLRDCTLYVTLEPCPMCAGAILEARMERLVYGAHDEKYGAAGSAINLTDYPGLGRRVTVRSSILQNECFSLLECFFRTMRKEA